MCEISSYLQEIISKILENLAWESLDFAFPDSEDTLLKLTKVKAS